MENDPLAGIAPVRGIPAREPIACRAVGQIAEVVRVQGFTGATFVARRSEVSIYHTDDLGMTRDQFEKAAALLVDRLRAEYPQASHVMQPYLLLMPKL